MNPAGLSIVAMTPAADGAAATTGSKNHDAATVELMFTSMKSFVPTRLIENAKVNASPYNTLLKFTVARIDRV